MMETMRDRFTSVASDILDADARAAVVLADIGFSRFTELGTHQRHPDRLINVGIREQLMISFAAGMALEGFRPIVHTYAPFLIERPFEQIKLDIGHQGVGAVLVSEGASYDAAPSGRTHQAPGDVQLMAALPGWAIYLPGHPDELEAILRHAMTVDAPVYIRMSGSSNVAARVESAQKATLVRRGKDDAPVVIAVGPMLDRVLEATTNMDVTVIYATMVSPFAMDESLLRSARDVVVVEPALEGTSLPAVSAAISGRPRRLMGIGVNRIELRHYGSPAEHDAAHGLDVTGIRGRLDQFC